MIAEYFLYGLIVHLVADWMLQSDWMALNKTSLKHPASWVHSGIHTLGFIIVYPLPYALALGVSHLLIDTRVPLIWWRKIFKQAPEGMTGVVVFIMQDQAVHIILIAVVALLLGR